jgi:KDO2-lipid IV(A) lauroyltransferase
MLWSATRLPYPVQMRLGRRLGRGMMRVAVMRRRIAEINLALCFPELCAETRRALLARHFESLGMGLMEVAMSWWAPDAVLQPLATLDGMPHLQHALEGGKGAILLSAHFTSLEMGGRLLTMHLPMHALYRPHKNPLLQAVMHRARERHAEKAIPYQDMRTLLRSLKENRAVWYAPDQNYRHRNKAFVPFFKVPAATNTATSRLARISGAPVLPFFIRRLDAGGYRLTLQAPLADFPTADPVEDTRRINELFETEIRKAPEQYLWVHRRFKHRPPGAPKIYRR